MKKALETLLKAGHISAAVELVSQDDDTWLDLVEEMRVTSWDWGAGSNDPNDSGGRIPEAYSFSHPCWEVLWDYLPNNLTERINLYFEEQGCEG